MERKKKVRMTSLEGNAFSIIGVTVRLLKKNGCTELVREYIREAISGDYTNLLSATMEYLEKCGYEIEV